MCLAYTKALNRKAYTMEDIHDYTNGDTLNELANCTVSHLSQLNLTMIRKGVP